jgi:hypothetical protein
MKTTLNIDDELMRLAKRSAVARGVTVTQVVEEALAAALLRRGQSEAFKLSWRPVHGHRTPTVDLADRDALFDLMEGRG